MITFYSLKELLSKGIDIEPIINEILLLTIKAKGSYPDYVDWFLNKHVLGIYDGSRDSIIAVCDGKLVGVANIKMAENKLCTLFFLPEYRRQRLGIKLVDEAIKYLRNSKPLITMPINSLPQFKNIIRRYNWELTDSIDDCYDKGVTELVFNGELTTNNKLLTNNDRLILAYQQTKDKNLLKLLKSPILAYFSFIFRKKIKKVLSN